MNFKTTCGGSNRANFLGEGYFQSALRTCTRLKSIYFLSLVINFIADCLYSKKTFESFNHWKDSLAKIRCFNYRR